MPRKTHNTIYSEIYEIHNELELQIVQFFVSFKSARVILSKSSEQKTTFGEHILKKFNMS